MKPIPFATVAEFTRTQRVPGWLTGAEARALYDLAAAAERRILEVGTYFGLSACFLAAPASAPVVTVDPHHPALWNPTQVSLAAERDSLAAAHEFWRALGVAERLTALRGTLAERAADPALDHAFDLIFLDADHHGEAVARDLAELAPRVPPGGTLALHDWGVPGDEDGRWDVAGAATRFFADHPGWCYGGQAGSLRWFTKES